MDRRGCEVSLSSVVAALVPATTNADLHHRADGIQRRPSLETTMAPPRAAPAAQPCGSEASALASLLGGQASPTS
jgi:hypothetical protein